MIIDLIPYDASTMEYTHYDNIQGMCMTNAEYFFCFASGAEFPTKAPELATLAAKMIKTGFVMHREFDSCFEMGNGSAVMVLLVDMALEDEELQQWWRLGEDYIGAFEMVKRRFYPNADQDSACNV